MSVLVVAYQLLDHGLSGFLFYDSSLNSQEEYEWEKK